MTDRADEAHRAGHVEDSGNAGDAERLDDIETKLSFAEDLLDTLNGLVYSQQRHIDRLEIGRAHV